MNRSVARLIATGTGIGRVPRAPGTAGALAALLAGALLRRRFGWAATAAAAAAAVAGGVWALRALPDASADPPSVVIDEIAGQLIATLGLRRRVDTAGLLAAFTLFRAFDIGKPGPIGWADRKEGPWAVMGDDIIAGAAAALLLAALRR